MSLKANEPLLVKYTSLSFTRTQARGLVTLPISNTCFSLGCTRRTKVIWLNARYSLGAHICATAGRKRPTMSAITYAGVVACYFIDGQRLGSFLLFILGRFNAPDCFEGALSLGRALMPGLVRGIFFTLPQVPQLSRVVLWLVFSGVSKADSRRWCLFGAIFARWRLDNVKNRALNHSVRFVTCCLHPEDLNA